jgi:hypothetical protein
MAATSKTIRVLNTQMVLPNIFTFSNHRGVADLGGVVPAVGLEMHVSQVQDCGQGEEQVVRVLSTVHICNNISDAMF